MGYFSARYQNLYFRLCRAPGSPELKPDVGPLGVDGVDDLLPGLHLLLTPDPGDVGEHFSLRRDSGGFCDQKGRGSSKERALLTAREVTSRLYGIALEMMVGPFITQVLYKLAE